MLLVQEEGMLSPANSRAQRDRLLTALRAGPVRCVHARDELGIFQPNTRIADLRAEGFVIHCHRERQLDARGYEHWAGVWVLVSEPELVQQALGL